MVRNVFAMLLMTALCGVNCAHCCEVEAAPTEDTTATRVGRNWSCPGDDEGIPLAVPDNGHSDTGHSDNGHSDNGHTADVDEEPAAVPVSGIEEPLILRACPSTSDSQTADSDADRNASRIEVSSKTDQVDPVAYPPRRSRRGLQKHRDRQPISARMSLMQKVNYALKQYGTDIDKLEEIDKRSPWGIMHAAISLGQNSQSRIGNRRVNSVDWLLNNGACRNMRLMYVDGDGKLRTRSGPGFEGHEGQLLAILAQSGVSPHQELIVENRTFKIVDLIRKEMDSCRPATELTFKLIGLSYYLDSDATWTSDDGEHWDIQRLITEELAQPINGVACGGTHRLMAFSFTLQRRKMQNREVIGEWARAEKFLQDYHQYALTLQNPDGSFSTAWFENRESMADNQRRLQTSGHILEWLIFSMDASQMRDPRIVRGVNYLSSLMIDNPDIKWSVGPKGHAIRALNLYRHKLSGNSIPTAKFGEVRMLR